MTLAQMIEHLQAMLDEGVNPDTEVKLAVQPSYPFEHTIAGLSRKSKIAEDEDGSEDVQKDEVIYICEGSGQEYATRRIWDCIEH